MEVYQDSQAKTLICRKWLRKISKYSYPKLQVHHYFKPTQKEAADKGIGLTTSATPAASTSVLVW